MQVRPFKTQIENDMFFCISTPLHFLSPLPSCTVPRRQHFISNNLLTPGHDISGAYMCKHVSHTTAYQLQVEKASADVSPGEPTAHFVYPDNIHFQRCCLGFAHNRLDKDTNLNSIIGREATQDRSSK